MRNEKYPQKTSKCDAFFVQTLQSNLSCFYVNPGQPLPAKEKKCKVKVKVCTRYVSFALKNEKRKEDTVSKALSLKPP